jgi:hypothetical protein
MVNIDINVGTSPARERKGYWLVIRKFWNLTMRMLNVIFR